MRSLAGAAVFLLFSATAIAEETPKVMNTAELDYVTAGNAFIESLGFNLGGNNNYGFDNRGQNHIGIFNRGNGSVGVDNRGSGHVGAFLRGSGKIGVGDFNLSNFFGGNN